MKGLVLSALLTIISLAANGQTDIQEIDPAEVATTLAEGALFVDVRETGELDTLAYDLPNVIHLPLSELPERADDLPRDRGLVLACRSGNRSMKAAKLLAAEGFTDLNSLAGGVKGWQEAGYPVERQGGNHSAVRIAGAMRNVMRKGQLEASIHLDTITDKVGLYGLGPQAGLTGELMINNGVGYLSQVTSDSTMSVARTFDAGAPFFVYANVTEWDVVDVPPTVRTLAELEAFITERATGEAPFAFKLTGTVASARIHVQNLPPGTRVSTPKEAHQGQISYALTDTPAEIVGFFSTEHQGVFTHHDSFLHMHLVTDDERHMGHLDAVEVEEMTLYLPRMRR